MQFRNKLRWQLSNHAVSNETSSTREVSQLESPLRHAITALREIALCGLGRIAPMARYPILEPPAAKMWKVNTWRLDATAGRFEDKKSRNVVTMHSAQTSGNLQLYECTSYHLICRKLDIV